LTSTSQFFRQTIYFATDVDVGWLDVFLIQNKQKNRKPEPAVKEHFRKFPFVLFFEFLNKKRSI
jgi:hypothetical protein